MKIETAIEILTRMATPTNPELLMNKHLAIRLGIEALKRVKADRTLPYPVISDPLPGETEE